MLLVKWLIDLNVDNIIDFLFDYLQSLFLEDYGLVNMMKEVQCSRIMDVKYIFINIIVDGWNVSKWGILIYIIIVYVLWV